MSVTYQRERSAGWITLADPERGNPLTHDSTAALLDALQRAGADRCRVVVLQAEGWAFSVGGDVRAFAASDDPSGYIAELARLLHECVLAVHNLDAIVISVVQGAAAGAGFPLALAADLVMASEDARFTLGYTRIGLTLDGGATLLARSIGLHRAMRLALLNDTLTSHEAAQLGLVSKVLLDLSQEVPTLVEQLLAGSAPAQSSTKQLLRAVLPQDLTELLDREAAAVTHAATTQDSAIGIAAFLARQTPAFAVPEPAKTNS